MFIEVGQSGEEFELHGQVLPWSVIEALKQRPSSALYVFSHSFSKSGKEFLNWLAQNDFESEDSIQARKPYALFISRNRSALFDRDEQRQIGL